MTYHCPRCSRRLTVEDRECGGVHTCGWCGHTSVVPDVSHRTRLGELFELQKQRHLTAREWREVAAHYRALGSTDKADRADLSAVKRSAIEAETAHVPELVMEPPRPDPPAPRQAEGDDPEPELRYWLPLAAALAAAAALGATHQALLPAILAHLALAAVVAAGSSLRGGSLPLSGAAALVLSPLVGGPIALASTAGGRTRAALDQKVAGAWLISLAMGLWLPAVMISRALTR
jgi:DNA-directed RNA polymerase subunit RPC12/RpoP